MNRLFILILSILLSCLLSCENDAELYIQYLEYKDYSVKNSYETNEQGTYLIIRDTSELNSVFNQVTSIDNPNFIKPEYFNSLISVAITKDLPTCSCPDMSIKEIKLQNNKLIINYNLPEYNYDNIHLCDIICRPYLLIMIGEKEITSIDFYENGILVKSIDK